MLGEQLERVVVGTPPCFGQREAPTLPLEQRAPEILLELADMLLTPGWVISRRRAVRVKLPVSTRVMKVRKYWALNMARRIAVRETGGFILSVGGHGRSAARLARP